MIRRFLLITLFYSSTAFATTWYVRPDGGTRYDSAQVGVITLGQCDGLGDASYVSTGALTNQHWVAGTAYAINTYITDNNGNYEKVTTAGTAGSTLPSWPTTVPSTGITTSDSSVVWTSEGAFPTNQHCAINDLRWLWHTGRYGNNAWITSANDTVLLRGAISTGNSYRIGCVDTNQCEDLPPYYLGIPGDSADSGMPPPPNGTTIGGENYSSCTVTPGQITSPPCLVQLHGGYGLYNMLVLSGSAGVTLRGLDITDFSSCSVAQGNCSSSNDSARNGIEINNTTTNLTLNNVMIHGFGNQGIIGPTGNGANFTNIVIRGNAMAGWNADAGNYFTGLGTALIQNFDISWNGCAEEYPIIDALPYSNCYDDNDSGYGDGFGQATTAFLPNGSTSSAYSFQCPSFGTPPDTYTITGGALPSGLSLSSSGLISGTPTASGVFQVNIRATDSTSTPYGLSYQLAVGSYPQGWQVHFDQGVVSYNTQDGLDALHLTGDGASMTITRVNAFGNMGQQIKVGGAAGTAINNVLTTNCNALRQAIPGTPLGYNTNLSDFCRAGDTGLLLTTGKGSTLIFDFNTTYSASSTSIEVDCDTFAGACDSTSLIDFRNNVWLGFLNNTANGYPGGGSGDYSNPIYNTVSPNPFANVNSYYANNATYNWRSVWSCPMTTSGYLGANESNALCVDPQLTNETWPLYGYDNVIPLSGSPVINSGVAISGITNDFAGNPRPTPPNSNPTRGAYELVGAPPTVNPFFSSGKTFTSGKTLHR